MNTKGSLKLVNPTNQNKASKEVLKGDVENLSRSYGKPVPRVLKPYVLEHFGLDLKMIEYLINFFVAPPFRERHKFDEVRFKIYFKKVFNLRPMDVNISISGNNKLVKDIIHPQNMEEDMSHLFTHIMRAIVDNFMNQVFPCYIHFLFKDTPLTPFPMPYFEMYMKSDDCHGGNVFDKFEEGDTISMDIAKEQPTKEV